MKLSRELPGLTPAQRSLVARCMCQDGYCGALDCYRCQGMAALDALEESHPVLFGKEEESES